MVEVYNVEQNPQSSRQQTSDNKA